MQDATKIFQSPVEILLQKADGFTLVYDRNLVSVSATETKIKSRYRFRGQNFLPYYKIYQKFS